MTDSQFRKNVEAEYNELRAQVEWHIKYLCSSRADFVMNPNRAKLDDMEQTIKNIRERWDKIDVLQKLIYKKS